jgi:heavy metal translocating P-type ATPase
MSSLLPTQIRKRKRGACSTHSNSVRERYLATLTKVGCICKELIARKIEPCCKVERPASTWDTTADARKTSSLSALSKKADDIVCVSKERCGDYDGTATSKKDECGGSKKTKGHSVRKENGCCGTERPDHTHSGATGTSGCPGENKPVPCNPDKKLAGTCCDEPGSSDLDECSKYACCNGSSSRSGNEIPTSDASDAQAADHADIEKGTTFLEHVVLNVQGLTCVGCETKLFRSLQGVPGVRNLRTSLVLSQAEFDLDEKAGMVIEVIKSVETTTGFTCRRLNNEGQEIDIIIDGDAKAFVERKYPDGITQMVASGKQTVRITYDAKVVGARAILEKRFEIPLKLAAPLGSSEFESGKKHVRNTAWITLLSAVLTIPVLVLAWAPLPPQPIVYGGASLALATIVQFAVAGPFYPSALRALVFTHVIEMDLLIVLSTSTAYLFSVVSFAYQVIGRPLPTGGFFETSTLLVTLIMLGRWVSAFARQRAVESVSIRSLQAETAVLCDAHGRGDEQIDARLLQYGDLFKVIPDSRITTDGVVVLGTTEVDESMVTGESLPVEKLLGSSVIAGSLNGSGVIVVRLTHLPGDNTISTIATMVDEAKFSKPKTQELVDVIASYFVPVILALTVITFGIWIAVGISVRHQSGDRAVVNAITYAISVLIVSCPCAIGLAVPMVVVISGGVAAKHGVVFNSAMAIETARKVSHVVFDKTGTLTQGELSVTEEVYLSEKKDLATSIALGLTCDSKHPVSAAISTYLKEKGVDAAKIGDTKSITGKGIEGIYNGVGVRSGNTRWLSADIHPEVQNLLAKGLTVFCVAMDDRIVAAFGLSDSLRPDSRAVITELHKRGIAVSILSGDDAGAVEVVADELGIQSSHVRSRCSPGDKQEYLKRLMTDENRIVIFCGDGTNDTVALAQADIGVHMNSGSDVAQTAADVVLMRPYLGGILVLLDLSKAAFHRIFFNFAWSFVYNLFAILLAAGAFVNARIPPQYAGLGEIVSVLPVILIALQLRWFRQDY